MIRNQGKIDPIHSDKSEAFIFPKWRLLLFWPLIIISVLLLGFQGLKLTINTEDESWSKRRDSVVARSRSHQGWRGNIYSKDNVLLAGNAITYSVGFDANTFNTTLNRLKEKAKSKSKKIEIENNGKEFLEQASTLLNAKKDLQEHARKKPTSKYLSIEHSLTPENSSKLKQLMRKYRIYSFNIESNKKRVYPNSNTGTHIVGIMNKRGKALGGSELWFSEHLAAKDGNSKFIWTGERTFDNKKIIDWQITNAAINGKNIRLTINQSAQFVIQKGLEEALIKHSAKTAAAVLLDAKTGAVYAMASAPSFNPNDATTWNALNLTNHALADKVEPGSTVKPATILAGLESNVISMATTINANKRATVSGYAVTDPRHYGVLNPAEVLKKSSNIGAMKLGILAGKENIWQMHKILGWGKTNPIHSFAEPDVSSLEHYDSWKKAEFITRTYGYGFVLDLLDLARLYLAIANDGDIPSPHIWEHAIPDTSRKNVAKAENIIKLRNAMTEVTKSDGTAPLARVNGFTVAGKTGTVRFKKDGQFFYRAFFAGMIPAEDPQLVMLITIEHSKEEELYYGGDSAAPIFGKTIPQLVRILGIHPYVEKEEYVLHAKLK